MSDKQKLLELDLDTDKVLAKSVELKSNINSLTDSIKELKKAEGDNTAAIATQEAALKKLNSEYSNNQKVLQALNSSNGKLLSVRDKTNLLLEEEINSIGKAKASVTELTKLRDQLNVTNKEEAKLLDQLNAKLNENNDFIKANSSNLEKQKINIGAYKDGAVEALTQTGLFTGTLGNSLATLKALGPVYDKVKTGIGEGVDVIKNARKGTEELTLAQKAQTVAANIGTGAWKIFSVALAATGITIVVGLIALLIGYFKTFDPVMDKAEQVTAALGAAFRVVSQTIVGFISGIKSASDLADKLGNFLLHPIDSLKSLGSEMKKAANDAATLKAAQQDLADQQAIQTIANKRQEGEIARLILQSKDRAKTEEERIALLKRAEAINQENFKTNQALADKEYNQAIENARIKGALIDEEIKSLRKLGIEYAYKLLNEGRITQDEVDMLTKAEESKIDIYNRSTSEQEKIINRQNALYEKAQAESEAREKKQQELRQKALDDAIAKSKAELDLFLSLNQAKAKSFQEDLTFQENLLSRKLELAKIEYEASRKTSADKLQLQIKENDAKNSFLQNQVQIIYNNAKAELDLFILNNKSKLENAKILSEELIVEESKRLESIKLDQINLLEQEKQTNQRLIDDKIAKNEALTLADKEYLAQKIQLEDETNRQIIANKEALDEQVRTQKAEQLAADRQIAINNAASEFEAQRLLNQQNYEIEIQDLTEKLNKEFITKEQFKQLSADADNKRKELDKLSRLNETSAVLGEFQKIGSGLKDLFAKNKEVAYATALINAGVAITEIFKTPSVLPEPYATVSRVTQSLVVAGKTKKEIDQINKVKLAKGDILSGPSHSEGGIPFTVNGTPGFEAEGGEAIINKKSTAMFAPLLSWINQIGGGKKFADGGYTMPVISNYSINSSSSVIDYELLASKIAQANSTLPPPIVYTAITDINYGQENYAQVDAGANH